MVDGWDWSMLNATSVYNWIIKLCQWIISNLILTWPAGGLFHCSDFCSRSCHYYLPHVSQYSRHENKTTEIEFQLFSPALISVGLTNEMLCPSQLTNHASLITLVLVSGISPVSVFCATLLALEARRLPRQRPREKLTRTAWGLRTERESRARRWTTDSSHLQNRPR